jgi:hypothetical protein
MAESKRPWYDYNHSAADNTFLASVHLEPFPDTKYRPFAVVPFSALFLALNHAKSGSLFDSIFQGLFYTNCGIGISAFFRCKYWLVGINQGDIQEQ